MNNDGIFSDAIKIGLAILAFVVFAVVMNSISMKDWNYGICPNCHVRYELRTETRYYKTYVCPECQKEVRRYFG